MDFRILIVEDELIVAYHIAAVLRDEGYTETRIAKNLKEALAIIPEFNPQLILTDIMMSSKPDGIKLGTYIRENLTIPFIYITSHGSIEMIREASRTRPNSYLVKPFKTPDLLAAIELALIDTETENISDTRKVWIKDGTSLIPFTISDILFLKAEENYTAVYTTNGKTILVRHLLSGVQNMLPENTFIRVHKSFVINRHHIISLKYDEISMGEHSVPVGRTYRGELQKMLA